MSNYDILPKNVLQYLLTKLKLTFLEQENVVTLTQAEYDALPSSKLTDGKYYFIKDSTVTGVDIDDTTTATDKVWSSSKVSTELSGKASSDALVATTLTVDTSNWTQDTTSQSGVTLYKKQIALSHVYVTTPSVDIGASGVLPTSAQQEAYNLVQYVTVDSAVPCLYIYASAIPSTSFYINVVGVD